MTNQPTKLGSQIQVGNRVKVGCTIFTVADVEHQTKGPRKGQIALRGRESWWVFVGSDEAVPYFGTL